MKTGPKFGHLVSEETRKKISLAGKGRPSWNKGRKMSDEQRKKLSEALKGRVHSEEYKKKMSERLKGRIFTEEHRKNLSKSKSGEKHHFYGKHQTPEHIEKRTAQIRGEKCHLWRGGITPINTQIRNSKEYKLWRTSVFERDNWTCIFCGERGGILQADHIKPFSDYPELRFAIDNGRTLCIDCHKKTDTYLKNNKRNLNGTYAKH